MQESLRVFRCARCRALVRLCRGCERGQRYCDGECAFLSRRDSCRRARALYRRSELGRRNNALHQKRWRSRQIARQQNPTVRDQGIEPPVATAEVDPSPQSPEEDLHGELSLPPIPQWRARATATNANLPRIYRCSRCGKARNAFERRDFLREAPRRVRRR